MHIKVEMKIHPLILDNLLYLHAKFKSIYKSSHSKFLRHCIYDMDSYSSLQR